MFFQMILLNEKKICIKVLSKTFLETKNLIFFSEKYVIEKKNF